MKKSLKKSPIIRIAKLKSPTGREVLERVTADGKLSRRAAANLGVKKVATWTAIEARTWAQATKLVRAGKGTKVVKGGAK